MADQYYASDITQCDNCGQPLGLLMFDVAVPRASWANLCSTCFATLGCRVGPGFGQMYVKQLYSGRWLKAGG